MSREEWGGSEQAANHSGNMRGKGKSNRNSFFLISQSLLGHCGILRDGFFPRFNPKRNKNKNQEIRSYRVALPPASKVLA